MSNATLQNLKPLDLSRLKPLFPTAAATSRNAKTGLDAELKYARRSTKRQMRHLIDVQAAANHLERLPVDGESFHCVMSGRFHGFDLVPAILRLAEPATCTRLTVCTLGFNKANASELVDLFDAGKVTAVDFIASCYFKSTSGDEFELLHRQLTARQQRCVAIRSHAKLLLFEMTDGSRYVVESSANLRSCQNVEQFCLTHDDGLLDFHRTWIDRLITEALANG